MRKAAVLSLVTLLAIVGTGDTADLSSDLGLSGRAGAAARNVRPRQISGGATGGAAGGVSSGVGGAASRVGGIQTRSDLRARTGVNASTRGVGARADVEAGVGVRGDFRRIEQGEDQPPADRETIRDDSSERTRGGVARANLVLRHRLAEIDHMRDLALEYGDEALLQRADELEGRVRWEHRQHLEAASQTQIDRPEADPRTVEAQGEFIGETYFEARRPQTPTQPTDRPNIDRPTVNRPEIDRPNVDRPDVPRYGRRIEAYGEAYGDVYAEQAIDASRGEGRPQPPRGEFYGDMQGQLEGRLERSPRGVPSDFNPPPRYGRAIEAYGEGASQAEFDAPPVSRPRGLPSGVRGASEAAAEYGAQVGRPTDDRVRPAAGEAYGRARGAAQFEDPQFPGRGTNYVNEAAIRQHTTASGDVQFYGPRNFEGQTQGRVEQDFYYGRPRYTDQPQPAPAPATPSTSETTE